MAHPIFSSVLPAARVIFALILRDMSPTYGRSYLGYAWAYLAPFGIITLLAIGFALIIPTPPLGRDFLLFYATGFLPFEMFFQLSQRLKDSLRFSRAILSYPRITWMDLVIARLALHGITQLAVFCAVIGVIMATRDTGAALAPAAIASALGLTAALGLGIGLMNAALIAYFPSWDRIWGVLSRPLIFASGVFFLYEGLPPAALTGPLGLILWLNPLLHITGLMRQGFYAEYSGDFIAPLYVAALAMTAIAMGLALLRYGYAKAVAR